MHAVAVAPLFFDYAASFGSLGKSRAIAAARAEALEAAQAYRVEYANFAGVRFFWDGSAADVIRFAESLAFCKAQAVTVYDATGAEFEIFSE